MTEQEFIDELAEELMQPIPEDRTPLSATTPPWWLRPNEDGGTDLMSGGYVVASFPPGWER